MKGRSMLFVGAGAIALALIGGGGWTLYRYVLPPVPVSFSDHVASWNSVGPYQDGGALESRTRSEIAHLTGLIGSGQFSDYDLYVGIAGQYELLGDYKTSYEYLSRAIRADRSKGLAYLNLGNLMNRLGAYHTARAAYERAVKVEPYVPAYQAALSAFLKARFPDDPSPKTP